MYLKVFFYLNNLKSETQLIKYSFSPKNAFDENWFQLEENLENNG
jgi:hypothetical protein